MPSMSDFNAFKEELLLAVKETIQNSAAQPSKKWLKTDEVKKMLNISSGTLQSLRTNGILPFTKIGGLIYYDADDIYKALSGKKHGFPANTIAPKKQQPIP